MHVYPRACLCIIIGRQKVIPWGTSRALNWENKTYKVKRSIRNWAIEEKGNVLEGLLRAREHATSSPGLTGKALGIDEVGEQGGRAREVKLKWPLSISLS